MCKWGTKKRVILCEPNEVSQRKEIMVDECIADIVQALNNLGIATAGACCGHGKTSGEIRLKDRRILIIREDYTNAA